MSEEKSTEWEHEEFMRAAAVAKIAVMLARYNETEPESEIGQAWDLVDDVACLRREVLAAGIPLR